METEIPHLEDDHIVIYVAVEGKDKDGILRRKEIAKKIRPQKVGKYRLRAIQTTTAVPMLQSADLLLKESHQGVILQSQIDPQSFLNGDFITKVYGQVDF
jgi:saccharopine dehydrogenase-like NADP-dependent oxidoreductase